jgi:hypothetical protein
VRAFAPAESEAVVRPWRGRAAFATAAGIVVLAGIGALVAVRGPQVVNSLLACPPLIAAAAVGVHAVTLLCRCEAWRVAVSSVADAAPCRMRVHAAAGAGYAAGALQGASTAPVRALTLRRLAPEDSPSAKQLVAAEAPVFVVEAALLALVLAAAVSAAPIAPSWAPVALIGASFAAFGGMRALARRAGDGGWGAGLRVLYDIRRRGPMVALLVATTALGLLRAWIVLVGFGLPSGPTAVALAFISLGVFGLLPIGPGSTPAALLAVFGAADPTAAAAAGIAISATSFAGVALYGGCAAASLVLARAVGSRRRGLDQVYEQRRPAEAAGREALPVEGVVVLAEAVPLHHGQQRFDDPARLRVVSEPPHPGHQQPGGVDPGRAAPAAEEVEPGPEARLVA